MTRKSAFPIMATEQSFHNHSPMAPEPGMSIREYALLNAMQGILSNPEYAKHLIVNDYGIDGKILLSMAKDAVREFLEDQS